LKPIAITMGDPCGIGPEILLRSFAEGKLPEDLVAFGDTLALERCKSALGLGVTIHRVASPAERKPGRLNVIDPQLLRPEEITPGIISRQAGAAAHEYIVSATRKAISGDVTALVTLPVNKKAVCMTDPGFMGHTELIAGLCGVKNFTMMLANDRMAVTHVSTHVSLADAVRAVTATRVLATVRLTNEALSRFIPKPRLAVAGLNPHSGEQGMFGKEEEAAIRPAIETAKAEGIAVEGPVPPDTVFYLAVERKRYDGVVCMYHDQGHIPMKLIDFEGGVNITLGLPIVRTSVDHGTAFDIAWKGEASLRSFLSAVAFAERLIGKPG
jgi:4-phospho-D-threonate 3-dehydrogenase / 4-phospho-D-erythronate 3-dehydrogenase